MGLQLLQRITEKAGQWSNKLQNFLQEDLPEDKEELIALLRRICDAQVINNSALTMMEGVLQVAEVRVRELMVPKAQMVVIAQDQSYEDYFPIVIESAHSRFPVIGDHEEVIGVLLAKDLLPFGTQAQSRIQDILHPAFFIPESKRLDQLLKEFQYNHNHMAIVVDEYSNTAGLITIEDVLEQIVGDIEDEYYVGSDQDYIKAFNETQYIVQAITPIEIFNQHFETDFSTKEFDTIGGLVAQRFGRLPKRGENIHVAPLDFNVLQADKRRIRLLQIKVVG